MCSGVLYPPSSWPLTTDKGAKQRKIFETIRRIQINQWGFLFRTWHTTEEGDCVKVQSNHVIVLKL